MPMATEMSCTSCEEAISPTDTSQVFRILPRNGMMACVSRSRACLAEPPAESPSTRNSSECFGSLFVQSANFPGSAGPAVTRLRLTCVAAFVRSCAFSMANCAMRSPASGCWLSHNDSESCTKPSTSDAARRDALLHLARELRFLDLDGEDEAALVEDVFGCELDAARHEIAELAEFPYRAGDTGAQAVHVCAAFGGGNEVDVAFAHRAVRVRRPDDGVLDDVDLRLVILREDRFGRQ